MKLLILTQKVDINDPILGFFCRWVEEFSKHCEQVTVICLEEGKHNFYSAKNAVPRSENSKEFSGTGVKVLSLGKEDFIDFKDFRLYGLFQKFRYVLHFWKYIWRERKNSDVIFVHMNQEYVLLGGIFWRIFSRKIYMWRNHHSGSFFTDIASAFCSKVFCTSKYSYTAKYKKTILMPVGVDTNEFVKLESYKVHQVKNSILFLGRISPSKNIHIFIEALGLLKKQGVDFNANIYGDALPRDISYFDKIKSQARELGLENILKFSKGVPNHQTPEIYNSHEIFVNLSSSGMYDKTIFEAMACGCLVLASNDNLKGQIDSRLVIGDKGPEKVATQISLVLSLPHEEKQKIISDNIKFAETHSLNALSEKLKLILSS